MFPLILLLALGAVAFAAGQKPSAASIDADLERLRRENPTAYAEVSRILREGASAAVLLQYGAQLDAQGYHAIARKFGEMAKGQSTSTATDPASVAKSALASGSADVMRGAAADLRAQGYTDAATALEAQAEKVKPGAGGAPTEVAKTIEPSMSPELQKQLDSALATIGDPAKLNALAALFERQGYPLAARVLREKATAILIQAEAAQAVRASDAVMKGQPIPAATTTATPTEAAVTATKAAAVVNRVAEAMANPTPEAVKAVAAHAVALSESAPVTADYRVLSGDSAWRIAQKFTGDGGRWKEVIRANPQKSTSADGNFKYLNAGEVIHLPPAWASNPANRALLVAAQNALASPSPGALATVAQASAALAAQNSTPATAALADKAQAAAAVLAGNPTAAQASRTAAITSSAANAAVSAAGVPIPQSGKTTYVVQKGDSAWKIAQAITGNGNRYPELIRANVSPNGKKTVVPVQGGGENFTSLSAGEVLKLPASWVQAAPKSTIVADLPAPGGAGSTAPDWTADLARMQKQNPNLYASTIAVKSSGDAAALMKASQILVSNPGSAAAYYPALSKAFAEWAAQKSMYGTSQPAVIQTSTSAPGAAQTYAVQSGDSPWRIAQKLAGDGARWKELVAANPQKSRAADGSFKTLNPGEVLNVPAAWAKPAPLITAGYRPPYPNRSARQMGYYPLAA